MLFKHKDWNYNVVFRCGNRRYVFTGKGFETDDKSVIEAIKSWNEYKLGYITSDTVVKEVEPIESEVVEVKEIDSELVAIQEQYKAKFWNLPARYKNDKERLTGKLA